MKTIITFIAIVLAVALGTAAKADEFITMNSKDNVAKLFIGNVEGVSEQDISMCQDSYQYGGKYYHRIYNATLECTRNHISVDFNHEE